jgi:hypothetical protein
VADQDYTVQQCARCSAEVLGLHGNYYCPYCEAVSQYTPPPAATATPDRDPTPPPDRR